MSSTSGRARRVTQGGSTPERGGGRHSQRVRDCVRQYPPGEPGRPPKRRGPDRVGDWLRAPKLFPDPPKPGGSSDGWTGGGDRAASSRLRLLLLGTRSAGPGHSRCIYRVTFVHVPVAYHQGWSVPPMAHGTAAGGSGALCGSSHPSWTGRQTSRGPLRAGRQVVGWGREVTLLPAQASLSGLRDPSWPRSLPCLWSVIGAGGALPDARARPFVSRPDEQLMLLPHVITFSLRGTLMQAALSQ